MQFLRAKTLVGPYEYVLKDDPALDRKAKGFAEAFDRAIETHDFSAVPKHPGLEPVVWRLRHLTAAEWRLVQDVNGRFGMNSACLDATALALVGVDGLVDFEVKRAVDRTRRGFEAVEAGLLEQLEPAVITELGLAVFADHLPRKG